MKFLKRPVLLLVGITFALSALSGCRLHAALEVYEGNSLTLRNKDGERVDLVPGELKIKIKDDRLGLFQEHAKIKLDLPESANLRLFKNTDTMIPAAEIGQDFDLHFLQSVREHYEIRTSKVACDCGGPRRPGPRCRGERLITYSVQVFDADYHFDVTRPGTSGLTARISGTAQKDGDSTVIDRTRCRRIYYRR